MNKREKAAGAANKKQYKDTENINSISLFGKKWYSKEDFRRKYQLSQFDFFLLRAFGVLLITLDENGVEFFRWERRWK